MPRKKRTSGDVVGLSMINGEVKIIIPPSAGCASENDITRVIKERRIEVPVTVAIIGKTILLKRVEKSVVSETQMGIFGHDEDDQDLIVEEAGGQHDED